MYGKLFSQMFDGTLGTKGPWEALVTFQQLVILADKNGFVDMTAEALSRRTTVPLSIIEVGLATLTQPDPDSRSPEEEGRRIVPIDPSRSWGWRVVNYEHYRKIRTEEERREYHKNYSRQRRAKAKHDNTVIERQPDNTATTETTNSSMVEVEVKVEVEAGAALKAATPTAAVSAMADTFTDPVHRDAYLELRRTAPQPALLDGEIRALLTGMRGKEFAPEDVGQALVDILMKGTRPSGLVLSRFAQVAQDARTHPRPTTSDRNGDGLSMDRVHELDARIKQREEAERAATR